MELSVNKVSIINKLYAISGTCVSSWGKNRQEKIRQCGTFLELLTKKGVTLHFY